MKTKITLAMLAPFIALAIMPLLVTSQNHFSGARNMGTTLNSTDNEIAPTISPNGLSLYLVSNRPGGSGGNDIWVSQRATLTSAWGTPQNLGATLNTASGENAPTFSRDGRTMFLASDRPDSIGGPDIYISMRTDPNNDFGWSAPVNLGVVVNSASNEIAPDYFEDPTTGAGTLIFSSNRVGNPQFDFHLYQSTRNADGSFNTPTLITELSAIGNGAELRSAITRDGLQIFFASARPGGLGSPPPAPPTFDTFVATRASVSAPWSTPVLVPGVNTVEDERNPSLSPDGSILYFQSNKAGGLGGTDLYAATRCSSYSASPCIVNRNTTADFDGDLKADVSIFRPSDGTWWILKSRDNTVTIRQFGTSGDKITPGDYDGEGLTDLAVFRPSDATWWILNSSNDTVSIFNWGVPTDKPVPGDYDGDGRTDIAVYRNGAWHIRQSSDGMTVSQQFGLGSDIPVAGVQ